MASDCLPAVHDVSWASVAETLIGVPVAVAVAAGPDGRLIYANDEYRTIVGDKPEDALALASTPDGERIPLWSAEQPVLHPRVATGWRQNTIETSVALIPIRSGEAIGLLVIGIDLAVADTEPIADWALPALQRRGDIVSAFERSLLERSSVELPASSELPDTSVWWDAVASTSGRIGLVAGVRSAGAEADGVLEQHLRVLAFAFAVLDVPPAESLTLLSQWWAHHDTDVEMHSWIAYLDPADGMIRYATAGAMRAVVGCEDGTTTVLGSLTSSPLGTVDHRFEEAEVQVSNVVVFGVENDQGKVGAVSAELLHSARKAAAGNRIELSLLAGNEPTRRARAFCDGALSTWRVTENVRVDIVLVVSELVSNAVLHGGGARRLRLSRDGRRITIEVLDSATAAETPHSDLSDAERGRGLHLMTQLSSAWGVSATSDGKLVWCEFDAPATEGDVAS